jgi:tetratricopeptide (TPR) repeat protein
VAVVREAVALTAYACGDYDAALAELRAYRRLSGDQSHLPLMADCERGLGRPSRAVELATSDAAATLPAPVQRELRIVAAGARSDLGQNEAALALLEQDPALRSREVVDPSVLRLRYAYADILARVGREDEAVQWFRLVAASDDGVTDAADPVGNVG